MKTNAFPSVSSDYLNSSLILTIADGGKPRPSCPHCKSARVVRRGGNRYQCKSCRHTFVAPDRRQRANYGRKK